MITQVKNLEKYIYWVLLVEISKIWALDLVSANITLHILLYFTLYITLQNILGICWSGDFKNVILDVVLMNITLQAGIRRPDWGTNLLSWASELQKVKIFIKCKIWMAIFDWKFIKSTMLMVAFCLTFTLFLISQVFDALSLASCLLSAKYDDCVLDSWEISLAS